jgi:hypothetical protein
MASNSRNKDGPPGQQASKRHYQSVPLQVSFTIFQKRERLIEMVLESEVSIYMAAKHLDINYSTAKLIIKMYQTEGRIYSRKSKTTENDEPPSNQETIPR